MLARSAKARNAVELGTSFGISTLHLASALRDNGSGRLITTEFEPLLGGAKVLYPEILSLAESRLGRVPLSSPTTPVTAPTISRKCARPQRATCRRHSPTTSGFPCGLADSRVATLARPRAT